MIAKTVTLQIPTQLYEDLQLLATSEKTDLVEVLTNLVAKAQQQRAWKRDLTTLREQIRQDGGLHVGSTKDEVVEKLRQTRREIFEAEYAHLYR